MAAAAGLAVTPGLESCHALVLNADFRPLSYFPLSVWSWQDAVKAVFLDRVSVVSQYERIIHSPSFEMRLPSVIALKEYVPAARRPAQMRRLPRAECSRTCGAVNDNIVSSYRRRHFCRLAAELPRESNGVAALLLSSQDRALCACWNLSGAARSC